MVFEDLKGITLKRIQGAEEGSDEIDFYADNGRKFRLSHCQNCCESVSVVDICGDINDLIGNPILSAEEVNDADGGVLEYPDSYTWTFYKLSTVKGSVTIRWLGESNGYYSESVDFCEVGQ